MCASLVIVTDDCGAERLIIETHTGYLVSYGDLDALKSLLIHALPNSIKNNQMVILGQEFIRQNMNWLMIAEDLEEAYTSVLCVGNVSEVLIMSQIEKRCGGKTCR